MTSQFGWSTSPRNRIMTVVEIVQALQAGKTVHWVNDGYIVVRESDGSLGILCIQNNNYCGVHSKSGVLLHDPGDFYVAKSYEYDVHVYPMLRGKIRVTAKSPQEAAKQAISQMVNAMSGMNGSCVPFGELSLTYADDYDSKVVVDKMDHRNRVVNHTIVDTDKEVISNEAN